MKPVSHMWRKMGSFSASVSYISAKRNVIKPFQLHYAIHCNHRTWPCKALQWKTPPVKLKNWMDKEVEEGKGRPVYFCFCGHDCACAHLYVCTLVKRAHLIHIKVPVCVFMFAWPISLQVCGRAGSSVSNRRGKRGQTHLCLLFLLQYCYVSLGLTLLSGCHLKDGATLTFVSLIGKFFKAHV